MRGYSGELGENGSDPGRLSEFVSNHREQLILILAVVLQQLLSERLGRCQVQSGNFGTGDDRAGCGCSVRGPDGEKLASLSSIPVAKANGDATGIDEHVKLGSTEKFDPLGPLDTSVNACAVDSTGRRRIGGEGEASTTGTTKGLRWGPGGSILSGEVCRESHLELQDRSSGILLDQRSGEISNGMAQGDIDGVGGSSGGRHCK